MAGPSKMCVLCGADVSALPRVKDPNGHYYCKHCHDKARAQQVPPTVIPPFPRPARAPAAAFPPPAPPERPVRTPPAHATRQAAADDESDLLSLAEQLVPASVDENVPYAPPPIPAPAPIPPRHPRQAALPDRPATATSYAHRSAANPGFFASFSDATVQKAVPLILLIGYGYSACMHLYEIFQLKPSPLVLLLALVLAALIWGGFFLVVLRLCSLVVGAVLKGFKRPVPEQMYLFLATVCATPAAVIQVGRWIGTEQALIIAALSSLPLAFLMFCMLFRNGFLVDVATFVVFLIVLIILTVVVEGAIVFGFIAATALIGQSLQRR